MSDFDKEAEREKLREKFEQEEERREIAEQMSDLLLKGATMLNVHCADCASPIFRHEGEEFCPTCNRSADEIRTAGESDQLETAVADADQESERVPTNPASTQSVDNEPAEPATDQQRPQDTPETGQVPETNAGEALLTSIARLADRAATAEDPRQAQELLDGAHRAAETFSLLTDHSGS